MRIAILDDYHDTLRTLRCFSTLVGHEVTFWNDHVQDNGRAQGWNVAARRWPDAARQDPWHLRYGRIGSVVAGYGQAFGMNVLVWAREPSLARAREDGHATASASAQVVLAPDSAAQR